MEKIVKWKSVLLQAEDMWAKIILDMPKFHKNSLVWKIYKSTWIRQYKMFIWDICVNITDSENDENIKNMNLAFEKNEFLKRKYGY